MVVCLYVGVSDNCVRQMRRYTILIRISCLLRGGQGNCLNLNSFQILSAWENCTVTLTVQMLVEKLKEWVKRGFRRQPGLAGHTGSDQILTFMLKQHMN